MNPVQILSIVAVVGAWVGGLGLIFSNAAFCFGFVRPSLFKWGFTYLVVADIGFIAMLAALLGILNIDTLWFFSLAGLVILLGLTVTAFIAIRSADKGGPTPAKVLEAARRRVEF